MAKQVSSKNLHVPPLEEICTVFQEVLEKNFKEVSVTTAQCPDLREAPFCLSAEGICGSPRLAEAGGVPYLVPLVQRDKVYSMKEIASQIGLPDAFIIGAGAGPHRMVGVNCEMMPNVFFKENIDNTHIALIAKDGSCDLRRLPNAELSLLANLFASEGKGGKVIKVVAKQRTGSDNFVSILRKGLKEHFGEKSVGIGGTFLIKNGTAKLHIMPDFSEVPLNEDKDVANWLQYYNFSAPLTCLSTFVSHDPGLDLRVEHTHCFSQHGEGGHYHHDTSPEDVVYEGYFNVAEMVYRIDPPAVTHNIGRD